ncbi:MAG: tRNA dihydrouridine synthase [Candidatus Dojkabacteria bacterium]|jgi:tRNA-dihydrouridine synthase
MLKALAPMEGVTDSVFRQMVCDIGKPDLFFTEFLNVEGFCSKGRKNVEHRIRFTEKERPVIIQLWGNKPEMYAQTINDIIEEKSGSVDGIDINIGCSVHDILSGGRGSALINNKPLVKEIICAVRQSLNSNTNIKGNKNIPVSVKTRLGFDSVDIEGWIGFLLKQNLDMITIHGRLSKETYATPSNWELIGQCALLRNEISPSTKILGNGDVKSLAQGEELCKKYNLDGFMVGRGILNNPWLFSGREDIGREERIQTLLNHLNLFESFWGDSKPFDCQKKYVKAYLNNFDGVNELRQDLVRASSLNEMREILRNNL